MKNYKVCFVGIQHHASMELIKSYLRQSNEISVIESLSGGSAGLIRMLLSERPDVFFTCNDTSETFTKISVLLNVYKIRFQEDPPQNTKWRESFIYDLKSPASIIHTGFDINGFGVHGEGKLLASIFASKEFVDFKPPVSPPLTDCYFTDPVFIKDDTITKKNIDIVFIGNLGEWTPENLLEEMNSRFKEVPEDIIVDIAGKIILHSIDFSKEITRINNIYSFIDGNTDHSIHHFYYEAIGRLRRINIIRFIVSEFGDEYNIHLYGHENMAEVISKKHYKGYLYDDESIKNAYRYSKIAVYSNSRPPLYNWRRFLEPYKYRCVGIVDYINISDEELQKVNGKIAELVKLIPKIVNIRDLKEIITFYLDDYNRDMFVNNIWNACDVHSQINITNVVGRYMRLFEYISERGNYLKSELDILKYDSEVIVLCAEIAKTYAAMGNIEKSDEFKSLEEYFMTILKDKAAVSPEIACEYACYHYRIKNYDDAIMILDAKCPGFERASILKAKIYEGKKDYQKIIDTLLDFKADDSELQADGMFLVGLALHNQGRYSDALGEFRKVAEINADFLLINYYTGLTMYCMNDMHGARKYLQEAFRKTKDFPEIGILLGDIYFKLGEYDESVRTYEYALDVVRTYEKIKEKEIALIEKLSLASLFNNNIETSAGYLDIIIKQYDENNRDAHVRLFLLLLSKGIFNQFFSRELAWLRDNNVSLLTHYGEIYPQFPQEINEKIILNALNLCTEDKMLTDFRNFLKEAINLSY